MSELESKKYENVTHCIFDMDGLLLDTEVIYEEIIRQIIKPYGKTYPYEVRIKVLGINERNSAEIIVTELNLPITVDEFLVQYHEMCYKMLRHVPLMKGAERLLRHLSKHKIPIALATSSSENMVNIKTTNHVELFKLFSHRVCGSSDAEVKSGKPSPDIFLIAAARFSNKPEPEKCLVFEDAPNGVLAAHNANMQCVMVPDERVDPEMCILATKVLKSLEHFKPEEFGLPPFSDE